MRRPRYCYSRIEPVVWCCCDCYGAVLPAASVGHLIRSDVLPIRPIPIQRNVRNIYKCTYLCMYVIKHTN